MFWVPVLLVLIFLFLFELLTTRKWLRVVILTAIAAGIMGIVIGIDYLVKTTDHEVWSGSIVNWEHKEEWDEFHPPHRVCHTDSNGNKKCHTEPGYWEHHPAQNHVETTDNGWQDVDYTLDGKRMDDYYPNSTSELKQLFPYGMPTSSVHEYTNKVQASYSIYRHKDIDLKKFPGLPEYPIKVHNQFFVDRIVGDVPNKAKALRELDAQNTRLNKMIPDPKNKGKMKSWKEANLIFVNVGTNKPQEWGFALQDHWEGGNKNDFIVAFSMDKKGSILWAYPFSWSDSELGKVEIKEYMEEQKNVKDFTPIVDHVSDIIADKFVRKEFKDFNYLHVDVSTGAYVAIWIFSMLILAFGVLYEKLINGNNVFSNSRQRSRY